MIPELPAEEGEAAHVLRAPGHFEADAPVLLQPLKDLLAKAR